MVDLWRIQALIQLQRGAWSEAERTLEAALAMSRDMRYPYAEAKALSVSGQLQAAQGEPERARECYEQALAICARLGERLYALHVERLLGTSEQG